MRTTRMVVAALALSIAVGSWAAVRLEQKRSEQIKEVKRAVVFILREQLATQLGDTMPSDARERYERIFSAATVDQEFAYLQRAFELPPDVDDTVMKDASATIFKWNGVRVEGDTAIALAEGGEHYRWMSGRTRDSRHVYEMHLVREDDTWKQDFLNDTDLDLG